MSDLTQSQNTAQKAAREIEQTQKGLHLEQARPIWDLQVAELNFTIR